MDDEENQDGVVASVRVYNRWAQNRKKLPNVKLFLV